MYIRHHTRVCRVVQSAATMQRLRSRMRVAQRTSAPATLVTTSRLKSECTMVWQRGLRAETGAQEIGLDAE